ncbi:MAG: radical SAM protein [Bacteroidales bacterium]|nr:radical SAM protein [Bacteroidales bacterium]
MQKRIQPYAVYSDGQGNIFEDTQLFAAGRSGQNFYPLYLDEMIPLPEGSDLFELPGRHTLGYNRNGDLVASPDGFASAAFIAPANTQLSIAAWQNSPDAPVLPLYAYTAVGWYKGKFYVPAVRIDSDTRQDCEHFNQKVIIKRGKEILKKFPDNRLVRHIIENCAFVYYCPAARNFAMDRWEAPVPTSPTCNARCVGCISKQDSKESPVPETQHRLTIVPTVDEIVQFTVPHLENAPNAIISFGQGCEGEPLMQWELLRDSIKAIRAKTDKGIINLNTNGSKPDAVDKLFDAGLDSIRVSMNSAQEKWYNLYIRPVDFTQADSMESLKIARKHGKWASINYFVMPGLTDTPQELDALRALIGSTRLNMIQWRNFNIDPDWLFSRIEYAGYGENCLGVQQVMKRIKEEFPHVYFGYFNPNKDTMAENMVNY